MVPLTLEVKRNARLEHDRRQAGHFRSVGRDAQVARGTTICLGAARRRRHDSSAKSPIWLRILTTAFGMVSFTAKLGSRIQIIGDDYLVTSAQRVAAAASRAACNAVLLKPNQAGTVTETKAALAAGREAGWRTVVSARSGETEDVTIVHLAVGWNAGQLKVGSFARSERMAKWNEGLRIEAALGPAAPFARWGRR
jgi:Enolase, C-terminal TIM barrel domain